MDEFGALHLGLIVLFAAGYALIALEHTIHLNKASIAITLGVICWTLLFLSSNDTHGPISEHLSEFISADAQIVFFLIGALTIVEIIHIHKGFEVLSDLITVRSKRKFIWVIGLIAFFLSALIDNLTTTVVMISLLRKLVPDRSDRLLIGGAVVVAANAGGAFSPIGDVTTTMLWIDGKISAWPTIRDLFIPSFTCFAVSTLFLMPQLKGNLDLPVDQVKEEMEPRGALVFLVGAGALFFVPIFKLYTGLPPMMGVLLGLGLLWILTDWLHQAFDRRGHLLIPVALSRIDTSSLLFFMGILMSVNALEQAGLLHALASLMQNNIPNPDVIAVVLGIFSAIIDNVPLVAASMGMYSVTQYPHDSQFWQLIAYCAGTGGSMLVIGSAAGVVYMGLEKVGFFWYLRRIGPAAAAGYFAGIGMYLIL